MLPDGAEEADDGEKPPWGKLIVPLVEELGVSPSKAISVGMTLAKRLDLGVEQKGVILSQLGLGFRIPCAFL